MTIPEQPREIENLEEWVQPYIKEAQEGGVYTLFEDLEPKTIYSLWGIYDRCCYEVAHSRTDERQMAADSFREEVLELLGVDVDDMELSAIISHSASSDNS